MRHGMIPPWDALCSPPNWASYAEPRLARDRRLLTGGAWGAILGAVVGYVLGVILKRRILGHR